MVESISRCIITCGCRTGREWLEPENAPLRANNPGGQRCEESDVRADVVKYLLRPQIPRKRILLLDVASTQRIAGMTAARIESKPAADSTAHDALALCRPCTQSIDRRRQRRIPELEPTKPPHHRRWRKPG
jgi:hypothetical protein